MVLWRTADKQKAKAQGVSDITDCITLTSSVSFANLLGTALLPPKTAHPSRINFDKLENIAANLNGLAVSCAYTNLAWLNSFACSIV